MKEYINILRYDLLSIFRELRLVVLFEIIIFLGYGIFIEFSKNIPGFVIYFLAGSLVLSLLEFLNRGFTFVRLPEFSKDVNFFVKYIFVKFGFITLIFIISFAVMFSFFTKPDYFLVGLLSAVFLYSSVVFYTGYMLLFQKKTELQLFFDIILYSIYTVVLFIITWSLYFFISYYVLLPILVVIIFIHIKWIPVVSEGISLVSYQILENSK